MKQSIYSSISVVESPGEGTTGLTVTYYMQAKIQRNGNFKLVHSHVRDNQGGLPHVQRVSGYSRRSTHNYALTSEVCFKLEDDSRVRPVPLNPSVNLQNGKDCASGYPGKTNETKAVRGDSSSTAHDHLVVLCER